MTVEGCMPSGSNRLSIAGGELFHVVTTIIIRFLILLLSVPKSAIQKFLRDEINEFTY